MILQRQAYGENIISKTVNNDKGLPARSTFCFVLSFCKTYGLQSTRPQRQIVLLIFNSLYVWSLECGQIPPPPHFLIFSSLFLLQGAIRNCTTQKLSLKLSQKPTSFVLVLHLSQPWCFTNFALPVACCLLLFYFITWLSDSLFIND